MRSQQNIIATILFSPFITKSYFIISVALSHLSKWAKDPTLITFHFFQIKPPRTHLIEFNDEIRYMTKVVKWAFLTISGNHKLQLIIT